MGNPVSETSSMPHRRPKRWQSTHIATPDRFHGHKFRNGSPRDEFVLFGWSREIQGVFESMRVRLGSMSWVDEIHRNASMQVLQDPRVLLKNFRKAGPKSRVVGGPGFKGRNDP